MGKLKYMTLLAEMLYEQNNKSWLNIDAEVKRSQKSSHIQYVLLRLRLHFSRSSKHSSKHCGWEWAGQEKQAAVGGDVWVRLSVLTYTLLEYS